MLNDITVLMQKSGDAAVSMRSQSGILDILQPKLTAPILGITLTHA